MSGDVNSVLARIPNGTVSTQTLKLEVNRPDLSDDVRKQLLAILEQRVPQDLDKAKLKHLLESHTFNLNRGGKFTLGSVFLMFIGVAGTPFTAGASIALTLAATGAALGFGALTVVEQQRVNQINQFIKQGLSYDEARRRLL